MAVHHSRVFFALWPSADAACSLFQLANELAGVYGGQVTRQENMHLTLAFIGAVSPNQIESLQQAAASVTMPEFPLRFDQCAIFPQQQILLAGCRSRSQHLAQLLALLLQALKETGCALPYRCDENFLPHITLLRRITDKSLKITRKMQIKWQCRDFMLMQSSFSAAGPRYLPLGQWPLVEMASQMPRIIQ